MASARGARILEYLQAQRGAFIELLQSLTLAESPSGDPAAHWQIKTVLDGSLRAEGFRTLCAAGRHVYAVPRRRDRSCAAQLILGHFDTVWPLGTLSHMPFTMEGDTVRGPGVYDMKTGLVIAIFALRALRECGFAPELAPLIFFNSDEEIGSPGSVRYIRRLARCVRRVWVLEPSLGPEGRLKTRRKGVGRYTVHILGKAAHAGLDPGAGASAILELSHVIQALFALNDPAAGTTVNVGNVDGGLVPNVVAPESSAVVDVRVTTLEDARRVDHAIRQIEPATPGVSLKVTGGMGRPPLEGSPRNRALWRLASEAGEEIGLELQEGLAGGGSDGNHSSLLSATLDGLGAVGEGAHASHESVCVDRSLQRAALLALLLLAPDVPDQKGTG